MKVECGMLFHGFHICEDGTKTIYNGDKYVSGRWVEGELITSGDKAYIHPRENSFCVRENGLSFSLVLREVIPETVKRDYNEEIKIKRLSERLEKAEAERDALVQYYKEQKGMLLRQNESGEWESYEPYATVACETKEDYKRLQRAIDLLAREEQRND